MTRKTNPTEEYGKCELCGNKAKLHQTTFCYGFYIQSEEHKDIVKHCKDCVAPMPLETTFLLHDDEVVRKKTVDTEVIDFLVNNKK